MTHVDDMYFLNQYILFMEGVARIRRRTFDKISIFSIKNGSSARRRMIILGIFKSTNFAVEP